jgi:hypothetical protein
MFFKIFVNAIIAFSICLKHYLSIITLINVIVETKKNGGETTAILLYKVTDFEV